VPAMSAAARRALLTWYRHHQRDLPWRRTGDPYAIWVSEVMLQQTQVVTVIPYWQRFLERFPTPTALAQASPDEVLSLWRGLGYYSRARNLHRAAQELVAHHGGSLPPSHAQLLGLPGFGRYTAGAVASIAFGLPAPILDGNVDRVLARAHGVEGPRGDRGRERALWALAERWVQGPSPGELNQALMELGAIVCRPTHPACPRCPLRAHCAANAQGRAEALPAPRVRATRKALALQVAVVRRKGQLLLRRRPEEGLFGGLWELPALELAPDATPATVRTGFSELLGARITRAVPLGAVRRTLTHRDLTLHLWALSPTLARLPGPGDRWRWAGPSAWGALGISAAMQRALALAAPAARLSPDGRGRAQLSITQP
jgi:A/G-specific adenine glycosylase